MDGICVEDCKLPLMEHVGNGRYEPESLNFHKGKMVQIGDYVTNIGGDDFVELVVQNPSMEWNDEYYMIKKSDRDKFFRRMADEVIQCNILPTMNEMNEFLRGINPDKIVSSGVDSTGCWVYYKTFIEKGWEE